MKIEMQNKEAVNSEHWERFYANNRNLNESSFCTEIRERFQGEFVLVDIGCGSGRDSFSFAGAGLDVFAVDRSFEAITANIALSKKSPTKGNLSFSQLDLGDVEGLTTLLENVVEKSHAKDKTIILYLRFLLHAIDEATERNLLDTISRQIPKGTYFTAEFRTKEDEVRSKTYDDHYRRFICTDEFIDGLENRGFEVDEFYKGTGLSVYKEEDPFLARVIARKV